MVGLPGLATDVMTVSQTLTFRTNLYKLKEEREIEPVTFLNMVSSLLYEKRSVLSPISYTMTSCPTILTLGYAWDTQFWSLLRGANYRGTR